jgi:Mg-chelatase subunit ChlD
VQIPSLHAVLAITVIAWTAGAAACAPTAVPAELPAPGPASPPDPAPVAAAGAQAADQAPPATPAPSAAGKAACTLTTGLALALVIDRSGSMSGAPLEMTKQAAQAAARKLRDVDHLDVIAFDAKPARVAQAQAGQQRTALIQAIGALQPSGGTEFLSALDMAYQDLTAVSACRKHILFLSDGVAPSAGIGDLASAIAAEGITISTVGLGAHVDGVLLKTMSDLGGGRYSSVSDPNDLPALFTAAVESLEKEVDRSR